MKLKRFGTTLALLVLISFIGVNANGADKTVKLRFSHNVPTTHPIHHELIVPWTKSIEKASNGTIQIQIFPAQQLGPAREHYNMARDGIADFAFYLVGIEPGRFPVATAAEIPFLVKDLVKGTRALHEWYSKYAEKEMSDVKLCLLYFDGGGTIHANKKIMRPADLKGMKIRSPNGTAARLYKLSGAAPIQVSASEAAEAMERGVADALSFPWNLLRLLGIDRVVKYHMDINFYALGISTVMNKNSYDKLSPAQKKVIDDHSTADWAERMPPKWVAWELEGRDALIADPKHTVYEISADDLNEWKKKAAEVKAIWAEEVKDRGYDPDKVFGELESLIKKYNAGY